MNGYGVNERSGGILLLVAMDDRKWHMSTGGECISIFTDAGLNYMQEQFVSALSVFLARIIAVKYHISVPVLKGEE